VAGAAAACAMSWETFTLCERDGCFEYITRAADEKEGCTAKQKTARARERKSGSGRNPTPASAYQLVVLYMQGVKINIKHRQRY
jgi:hypothetical protein